VERGEPLQRGWIPIAPRGKTGGQERGFILGKDAALVTFMARFFLTEVLDRKLATAPRPYFRHP